MLVHAIRQLGGRHVPGGRGQGDVRILTTISDRSPGNRPRRDTLRISYVCALKKGAKRLYLYVLPERVGRGGFSPRRERIYIYIFRKYYMTGGAQ